MGTRDRGSYWYNRLPRTNWVLVAGFVLAPGEQKGGKCPVVKVLECVGEHYKVQDVQRAKVYRWRPATIALECECGERLTLTSSTTTCSKCGEDHTDVVAEVLETHTEEDEGHHPWGSLRSYFSRPKPI
jgi:hypothetical protein